VLKMDQVVKFTTVNDAVLNELFDGVKVVGIIPASLAKNMVDIYSRHAALWPYVQNKNTYKDDADSYSYYVLQFPNGETTVVGEAWITPGTIEQVEDITRSVFIRFKDRDDLEDFTTLLNKHGYDWTFQTE